MGENGGMIMKLYHGTTIPELEVLKANSVDRDGNRVLYLTDNYPYSLFYIRDREIDFVTCGVRERGIVHYDEKFRDQLKILYQGMSGWVYEVEADAEPTKISGIYVTGDHAKVIGKYFIPDALAAIKEAVSQGYVNLFSYEDTTEEQRNLNQEGMVRWFLSDRQMYPKKKAFLRTHFPDAWEEAQRRILDKAMPE